MAVSEYIRAYMVMEMLIDGENSSGQDNWGSPRHEAIWRVEKPSGCETIVRLNHGA